MTILTPTANTESEASSYANNVVQFSILKPALLLFILLAVILGLVYPLAVTAVSQVVMPHQANGSLINNSQGRVVGSSLIGQKFDDPNYLWGRPSAANYDAKASTGSNLGPLNPELANHVQTAVDTLKASDPSNQVAIPLDLVTTSASGLDPHISPAAAAWQVNRIAKQRGISPQQVKQVIDKHTRQFGLLGEPVVNVLAVNMALDKLANP